MVEIGKILKTSSFIFAIIFHGLAFILLLDSNFLTPPNHQIINSEMVMPNSSKSDSNQQNNQKNKIRLTLVRQGTQKLQDQDNLENKGNLKQITSGLTAINSNKKFGAITKSDLVEKINNQPPQYPKIARLKKQQGTVVIEVFIKNNGAVEDLSIKQSSGYEILDEAALKTIKTWQFEANKDSKRSSNILIPITFTLN